MPLSKTTNFGNPNIGLFAKASEKFAAVDVSASPKLLLALGSLGVPVLKTTLGNSGLVGIFLAMNSNGAVVPRGCSGLEIAVLKEEGLNVAVASSHFSAAGNNIAANDFGAVANPELSNPEVKRIADCLGVEVARMKVAGYLTAGSAVLATNKGFAAHNRASEAELKELQSILKVRGTNCTVNTGTPFVPLGAVANSKASVFGEATTGFEAGRIFEALDLV